MNLKTYTIETEEESYELIAETMTLLPSGGVLFKDENEDLVMLFSASGYRSIFLSEGGGA